MARCRLTRTGQRLRSRQGPLLPPTGIKRNRCRLPIPVPSLLALVLVPFFRLLALQLMVFLRLLLLLFVVVLPGIFRARWGRQDRQPQGATNGSHYDAIGHIYLRSCSFSRANAARR